MNDNFLTNLILNVIIPCILLSDNTNMSPDCCCRNEKSTCPHFTDGCCYCTVWPLLSMSQSYNSRVLGICMQRLTLKHMHQLWLSSQLSGTVLIARRAK